MVNTFVFRGTFKRQKILLAPWGQVPAGELWYPSVPIELLAAGEVHLYGDHLRHQGGRSGRRAPGVAERAAVVADWLCWVVGEQLRTGM